MSRPSEPTPRTAQGFPRVSGDEPALAWAASQIG